MLTQEVFWELIGTLGGVIDQESAQTLTDRLAAQPPMDIVAFAGHLAQMLDQLDGPERAAQLVVDSTVSDEPMTMSDDLFLYARCAVVAAGRETFDVVLADPARMAGTWPVFDGEHLLGVAPAAYQAATGEPFDPESVLSDETDSTGADRDSGPNTDIKTADPSDREPSEEEVLDVAVQDRRGQGWMSVTSRAENMLPWRPVYQRYQGEYLNWINHDYGWTRWWVGHRYRDLTINAWLDPDADESLATNKPGKDLTLDLHLDGQFLLSTDRRVHLHRARADLQRLLDLAVDRFGLNPTPPLPPEPAPPAAIDLDEPEPNDGSSRDSLWWEWMASPWDPSQQQLGGPRLGPF